MTSKKRNTGSRLLALFTMGALLLAACGGDEDTPAATGSAGSGSTGEPATLKVALDWFPNPDHVGLYYALDNGYFADQNLTVEFETPSDVTAGLKLVARNQFDLSIFYQGDMFFAAQEGLPVIAVGSLVPQPLNSLMALADSKVQGVDSVKGATIGVAGLPFDDAILATIRKSQGLAEGDVESVNVGFDLVPGPALEAGGRGDRHVLQHRGHPHRIGDRPGARHREDGGARRPDLRRAHRRRQQRTAAGRRRVRGRRQPLHRLRSPKRRRPRRPTRPARSSR